MISNDLIVSIGQHPVGVGQPEQQTEVNTTLLDADGDEALVMLQRMVMAWATSERREKVD